MKKTLGFLLGLILRVLLSVVVALWASSRLFVIIADTGVQGLPGIQGFGLMSSSQGLLLSVLDNAKLTNNMRLLNSDDRNGPGDWSTFTGPSKRHWSALGTHIWVRTRMAPIQLGISFPAAIVALIVLYWFSRRLGRRTPGKLSKKLAG